MERGDPLKFERRRTLKDMHYLILLSVFGLVDSGQILLSAPVVREKTSNSLLVDFEQYSSIVTQESPSSIEIPHTIAYELSYRSIFDANWSIASNKIGIEGSNISVSQIVSVRVDPGRELETGIVPARAESTRHRF